MEKETILPKNVRQIGDIQGNVRIYMEDYVMTFIHKKEQQEERGGFLGVFLGETQRAEDEVRIFIRGLMEVSSEDEARRRRITEKQQNRRAEEDWEESSDEEWRENAEEPKERKDTAGIGNFLNKKFGLNKKPERSEEDGKQAGIGKDDQPGISGQAVWFETRNGQENDKQAEKENGAENTGSTEKAGVEHKLGDTGWIAEEIRVKNEKWTGKAEGLEMRDSSQSDGPAEKSDAFDSSADMEERGKMKSSASDEMIPAGQEEADELPPRTVREECREYFGAWEILGCCVIGEYPVERMKKLTAEVPQSQMLIYHLQEQEENLYCTENGRYEQVSGYFVFYEQNRLMQEYMAEALQENRTDKEGISDQAIKNFRKKIKQKDQIRTGSMLKMASSFFVVTVLVIGAITVNRIDRIRGVSSSLSETAENEVYQNGIGNISGNEENGAAASGNLAASEAGIAGDAGNAAGALDASAATDTQNTVMTGIQDMPVTAGNQNNAVTAGTQGTAVTGDSQDTDNMTGIQQAAVTDTQNVSDIVDIQDTAAANASQGGIADFSDQSAEKSGFAGNEGMDSADQGSLTGSDETVSAEQDGLTDAAAEGKIGASGMEGTVQTEQTGDTGAASEAAARQTRAAYVIKEGDTLADICQKYYGSLEKLDDICSINGITNANMIMPGDKIMLP